MKSSFADGPSAIGTGLRAVGYRQPIFAEIVCSCVSMSATDIPFLWPACDVCNVVPVCSV